MLSTPNCGSAKVLLVEPANGNTGSIARQKEKRRNENLVILLNVLNITVPLKTNRLIRTCISNYER